jgi:hypothetical protein
VRLGSRATDERISQYSLRNLEQLSGRGELDRPMRREYAIFKKIEEDMTRIVNRIQLPQLTWEDAEKFLDFHHPQHADCFREPPFWIAELFRQVTEDEKENGEWKKASKDKKASRDPEISGIYGFWKSGRDIEFIQPPSKSKGKKGDDPRVAFFDGLGFSGKIPSIPSGLRPLELLLGSHNNVWSMSLSERECLSQSWEEDMRNIAYESNLAEFEHFKERYMEACKNYEDIQDEVGFSETHSPNPLSEMISRFDVDFLASPTSLLVPLPVSNPFPLEISPNFETVGAAKLVSLLTVSLRL